MGWKRPKDAGLDPPMPRNARADAGSPPALTCADVRAREWDFVEGVLPLPERTAMQAHLDACSDCRRETTLCRNVEGALLSAPAQIPLPGDLRAEFYARLAAQQRPSQRFGRPVALSALAFGVLAVMFFRPALQTQFASHPLSVNNTARPALSSLPPTTIPSVSTLAAAAKLPPLRSIPGLSEAQANRLFASVETHYIVPLRRRTLHVRPSVQQRSVTPPERTVVVLADSQQKHDNYAYMLFTPGRDEQNRIETAAKTFVDARLREQHSDKDTRADRSDFALQDVNGRWELSVASMPPATGVSLEVTDQVRGFSNTTRVASDVEVQGDSSTIHVEADGN